jgi:hypothetical protein
MQPKAILMPRHTPQIVKEIVAAKMAEALTLGRRVVIGAMGPAEVGQTLTRLIDSPMRLVIKRRATREEFLAACPLEDGEVMDRSAMGAVLTSPFYYELELVHAEPASAGRVQ